MNKPRAAWRRQRDIHDRRVNELDVIVFHPHRKQEPFGGGPSSLAYTRGIVFVRSGTWLVDHSIFYPNSRGAMTTLDFCPFEIVGRVRAVKPPE